MSKVPGLMHMLCLNIPSHVTKLHPPDKSDLKHSTSPKSPFNKVALVQHGGRSHTLCPAPYTDKKEKHLGHSGDKALGDENTHQPMISPLIPLGSIDLSPNHAQ